MPDIIKESKRFEKENHVKKMIERKNEMKPEKKEYYKKQKSPYLKSSVTTCFRIPISHKLEIMDLVKQGYFFGFSDFVRFAVFRDLFSINRDTIPGLDFADSNRVLMTVKFPAALYDRMQYMLYGEASEYIRKVIRDFLYICKQQILNAENKTGE